MLEGKDSNSLNTALSIVNNSIRSSHYMASTYKKIASNYRLSESQLIQVINSAGKNIRSSHNLSNVLVVLSKQVNRSSTKVKDAYRRAAKSIKSDTYYGRAIKVLD